MYLGMGPSSKVRTTSPAARAVRDCRQAHRTGRSAGRIDFDRARDAQRLRRACRLRLDVARPTNNIASEAGSVQITRGHGCHSCISGRKSSHLRSRRTYRNIVRQIRHTVSRLCGAHSMMSCSFGGGAFERSCGGPIYALVGASNTCECGQANMVPQTMSALLHPISSRSPRQRRSSASAIWEFELNWSPT